LNILAADDTDTNRRLLERFVARAGHDITVVCDGREAVDFCELMRPDLILMDVMMPDMDGLEATRQIRKLFGDHWVPIIFLTAKTDPEDVLEGLAAGGDDYLLKPIDTHLLAAKINVMARISDMQRRIAHDADRLSAYFRANEAEQDLARHVLNGLTGNGRHSHATIQQWIQPAVQFSGDVITVSNTPSGCTYLMLADSTGHGLAAAISCVPAVLTFYSMAEKDFSIEAIAREINTQLRRSLPVGRFVAAVLVAIDERQHTLSVWNGGLPEALVIDRVGEVSGRVKSTHAPLGILVDEEFDPSIETVRWSDDATVILCSDGVTEARNGRGEQFGTSGLLEAVTAAQPAQRFDALRNAVTAHLGGTDNHDDVSFVVGRLGLQAAS